MVITIVETDWHALHDSRAPVVQHEHFIRALVAGWHFHFVTADRKQGGHVLDCQVDKATASIDLTKEFDLALPSSEKFEITDFTVDRSADVKKAETNE